MPHIVLEHSANAILQIPRAELFTRLHRQVNEVTGVLLSNCKSRRYIAEDFRVGDGDEQLQFIHLSVRMIEGRSSETKHRLGNSLVGLLRQAFNVSDDDVHIQVTVEVSDIKLNEYSKFPSGSLTPQ